MSVASRVPNNLGLICLLAWLVLLQVKPAVASESSVLLSATPRPVQVGPGVSYLLDPDHALSFAEMRALADAGAMSPQTSVSPHFGYDSAAIWMHSRVQRHHGTDDRWVIEIDHPLLREIDAWVELANGDIAHFRGGHSVAADQWPIKHRVFAFPVDFKGTESARLYLRIAGDSSLQVPLRAWQKADFQQASSNANLMFGMVYGVILALLVYNLLLYIGLRDTHYLLYVIYVGASMLTLLTVTGFAFWYLWPAATGWAHLAAPTLGAVAHVALLVFARDFLQLPRRMPRCDKYILWPLLATLVVVACLPVLGAARLANQILMPLMLATSLVVFVIVLLIWWGGLAQARYFLVAWIALLVGMGLYAMRAMGLVPNVFFTEYGILLGTAAEMLLLSLALAHRVRVVQEEKDLANREAEKALQRRAYEDPVTELPSRRYLQEKLESLVSGPQSGQRHGLILLGPERFPMLLAGRGYKVGDEILCLLGQRLQSLAGELAPECARQWVLGRFSGSTFGMVLQDVDPDAMRQFVERLSEKLQLPILSGEREYHFTMDIACTVYPFDGVTTSALMRNAQAALAFCEYKRGGAVWFDATMAKALERQLHMEQDLRLAAMRGELRMCYQPQIDIRSGQVAGMEALIRWTRNGAAVSASEFIPLAETSGLIAGLGRWIFADVTQQVARWKRMGLGCVPVAINISAMELSHPGFVEHVVACVNEAGIDPGDIELEITETAAMTGIEQALARMHQLRKLGFGICIDDFGTGHSSMAYLHNFPVQKIKIDQSFIRDIGKAGFSPMVLRQMIELARGMNIRCVAEGVETEAQLEKLRSLCCELVQGFFFSRPLAAENVPAYIAAYNLESNPVNLLQ